jgi:hypothetical protein
MEVVERNNLDKTTQSGAITDSALISLDSGLGSAYKPVKVAMSLTLELNVPWMPA